MRLLENIISIVFWFCSITSSPVGEDGHAESVKRMETSFMNPDEIGGSDILRPHNTGRSGIMDKCSLWNEATIPVLIDLGYTDKEYAMIEKAMRTWEYWTCIKFVSYTPSIRSTVLSQPDYIVITSKPEDGCRSFLGRIGGMQEINLESSVCFDNIGIVLHELFHAIGAVDEHRRPDRDDYITINTENILPENLENFEKEEYGYVDDYGIPYDYNSIMHYSAYAASSNGNKTIEAKKPLPGGLLGAQLGQRAGISVRDAMKVMKMYRCDYNKFNLADDNAFSRVMPNYGESPLPKDMLYNIFFMNISYNY